MLTGEVMDHEEVSFIEQSKAFQTLLSSDLQGIQVFFIVDGIDEYEGEHNDICEMFFQAETSTSVKILLSSWPIPACVLAFSTCPQLSLQILTEGDNQDYFQDKLGQHAVLRRMELANKGATRQILSTSSRPKPLVSSFGLLLW